MSKRKLIYTPRQASKPKKKEDRYKELTQEVAVYKRRYSKKLSRFLLVVVLLILLVALYFLLKAFFAPQTKIYIKLFKPESHGFIHTTIREVNETLHKNGSVRLQVKAICKQDPYLSPSTNMKINRDYVLVKFLNVDNEEIGKAFFELRPTEDEKMMGTGVVLIEKDRFRNNTIQDDVIVILTNATRTADKLPTRISIVQE